jgi:D-beta-D-heptose 7-phosphate kinase/D-beta-D-heptose 1-phosphate adenosyltransferase
MNKKIKKMSELEKIVKKLKKQNKKIVTCNGTFDILHIGHVKFLQEAKQQGDILIVGLNSDKSVKINKGPKRPINNEKNRAKVLSALECVDYIVIFNEKDPRKLLSIIKPDIHVNGEEYGYNCIEAETIKKYSGKIHLVKNFGGFSTTKLVNNILKVYSKKKATC